MKHGFIKVAAATPDMRVADVKYNVEQIKKQMDEAVGKKVMITVFPELCITGYTCGELFFQDVLLKAAIQGLEDLAAYTGNKAGLYFFGMPLRIGAELYNVAVAVSGGEILGIVPKTYIPTYGEFYEGRYFSSGADVEDSIDLCGQIEIPFGTDLLFAVDGMPDVVVGAEICEDVWTPCPPSIFHAMAGATIIVNLSASNELAGKTEYRRDLIKNHSAKLVCGYIYANPGCGESTMDVVYSGHNIIAENGNVLAESAPYANGLTISEIDVLALVKERQRLTTFTNQAEGYYQTTFSLPEMSTELTRTIENNPFLPADDKQRKCRLSEVLDIQAYGLVKRMRHTHCTNTVIGISGGLDSTLALLVTAKAYDILGLDKKGITAVTMPGFGTTDRTYQNALAMIEALGATTVEISIKDAVLQHFKDIGHDVSVHDVTYENSQARERTQILMDLANKVGGMVIGTGDLSELVLGWATYNGDHMSMYAVNASVPKTMVRYLVEHVADTASDGKLSVILKDVLDTPVSPELLPPSEGQISQKTEELVGPYELHDFVMYYVLRHGFSPEKIFRMAKLAFAGIYDEETIKKWMITFYRRFFSQQFKRSCLPDGPKTGSISVSPRGDLRMPSDACVALWLEEVQQM